MQPSPEADPRTVICRAEKTTRVMHLRVLDGDIWRWRVVLHETGSTSSITFHFVHIYTPLCRQ